MLFLRKVSYPIHCHYHNPVDHFIAIEEATEAEDWIKTLFPGRFRRVFSWFEIPYLE